MAVWLGLHARLASVSGARFLLAGPLRTLGSRGLSCPQQVSVWSLFSLHIQEDAHCVSLDLDKQTNTGLFAIFDGHGGSACAQFCAKHLVSL